MKYSAILIFLFVGFYTQAQEPKKSPANKETVKNSPANSNTSAAKTTTFTEGVVPTPEEQGFTKKNVNGREVYVKESGNIYIEYQPK